MLKRNSRLVVVAVLSLAGLLSAQTPTPLPTPAPSPTPVDEFTIVALPDTQFYSSLNPQIFAAQTQWIANHVQDQNIQLVVGLGDIVDAGGDLTQWQNADAAVRLLSGKVPYMMAIGNHDYDQNKAAGYFGYFGAAAGPAGKGYYSYDLGSWHLISLDTNCSNAGG